MCDVIGEGEDTLYTTHSIHISYMHSTVPPVGVVMSGELVETNLFST